MDRVAFSQSRIKELAERLSSVEEFLADQPLCIYATGSYGRLEAWSGSDIDLFFLWDGHPEIQRISNIAFIKLTARLIEATEEMEFPPFSGDGRYLEVQYVDQMEEILGSPEDDGLNAFTARMLLLLESRPVYGSERYEGLIRKVIDFYYRDLRDHEQDFLPVFLTNDILRFWRTLTLNYEHDRFEISRLDGPEQDEARAKSALKNYKLKVSRLATCFSMVVHLASEPPPILQLRVFELCQLTPSARFEDLQGLGPESDRHVENLLQMYAAFLERIQKSDEDLLGSFRDPEERRTLLAEAASFGGEIFGLLRTVTNEDRLRHLVV